MSKVNEIYGFDWQEGRNCGDLFLYETAKTITATKPGAVCIGLDCYNQILTGGVAKTLTSARSDCDHLPCVIILHHHIPNVTKISSDQNNIQTLIARGGTGGGNVPLIMQRKDNEIPSK